MIVGIRLLVMANASHLLLPGNSLEEEVLGQRRSELVQSRCGRDELGVGLSVLEAAAPLVHGKGVGEDHVLLDLGPPDAVARVTSSTPAHD